LQSNLVSLENNYNYLIERNKLLVDIDTERSCKIQDIELMLDQEKTRHANESRKFEIESNFNLYNKNAMKDLIQYLRLDNSDAV